MPTRVVLGELHPDLLGLLNLFHWNRSQLAHRRIGRTRRTKDCQHDVPQAQPRNQDEERKDTNRMEPPKRLVGNHVAGQSA